MFSDMVWIRESKCPGEQRDSDLMDVAQANRNFYLEVMGNNPHLKPEHPYYFQLQCQLALTGAAFNDFIVYTHQSLLVERFPFNEQFWDDVRKVGNNYFSYILPKLV